MVLGMLKHWVNRNVDLDLLSGYIERFLEDRGFKTMKSGVSGECTIQGITRPSGGLVVKVVVRVLGAPNDFSVEFGGDEGKHTRLGNVFGSILTLFGGGFLLSQSLKRQEKLDKLERKFSIFVEEMVDRSAV